MPISFYMYMHLSQNAAVGLYTTSGHSFSSSYNLTSQKRTKTGEISNFANSNPFRFDNSHKWTLCQKVNKTLSDYYREKGEKRTYPRVIFWFFIVACALLAFACLRYLWVFRIRVYPRNSISSSRPPCGIYVSFISFFEGIFLRPGIRLHAKWEISKRP